MMKAGSCSNFGYKPRQDRKVAAVSSLELCAGKPGWSFYPLNPFWLKTNLSHDRVLEAHRLNHEAVRLVNVFIEL